MADFKYLGKTYELILHSRIGKKPKNECICYVTGFRNLWERISYAEYTRIKKLKIK